MDKDMMTPFNDDFDDDPMGMNSFFGDLGNMFNRMGHDNMMSAMPNMRANVTDDGKAYHVTAELPGFKKNSIHLDYRDNVLSVRAKHNINRKMTNNKGHVLRQEYSNSNVSREFRLPNVDFNKITASYDGGMLKVNLPHAEAKNDGHQINIK